jgi:hypothetical protein
MTRRTTMPAPETKLSKLLELMTAERWDEAIHFAAKFPQLGQHKAAITRAHDMALRPQLYLQMGRDPATIRAAGIAALKERYAKPYQEALKTLQRA